MVLFYHVFNIPIADYLEIGEYATLFVDDLLAYLAIFGLGLLVNLISISKYGTSTKTSMKIDFQVIKARAWIIGFAILIVIAMIITILYAEIIHEKLEVIKVGAFILMCSLYIFSLNTNLEFSFISLIALTIIIHAAMDGLIDGHKIIDDKTEIKYKLVFDNQKIEPNDNLKYIGKSEKYVFLYDTENKNITIIPIEKLIKIQINPKEKR